MTALDVSITIEPHINWQNAAALAITSLRMNGAQYANAHVYLNVNGLASREIRTLNHLNLTIVPSERHTKLPHLSKASAAQNIPGNPERTHVLILDHDTVILDLQNLDRHVGPFGAARQTFKTGLSRRLGDGYEQKIDAMCPIRWRNWSGQA